MADTIGLQLKQAREAKNLTIQKVVQVTHIRAPYIEAIEADDFDSLPSPIQARAFLKLYAEFLGTSLEEAIARQRNGVADQSSSLSSSSPLPIQIPSSEHGMGNVPGRNSIPPMLGWLRKLFSQHNHSIPAIKKETRPKEPEDLIEEEVPLKQVVLKETPLAGVTPGVKPDNSHSQMIFISIGKTLKQRRESLSLTLDEIERHTHVRKHYLVALEAGEYASLPSSVQARGMLSNYAHFLNLDIDSILLTFADGLQAQLSERQVRSVLNSNNSSSKYSSNKNLPIKIPAIIRRYISVDIIVGGGLVVLLVTFAIWGTSRIINLRSGSTPQPSLPPMLNILNIPTELTTATPELITTGKWIQLGGSRSSRNARCHSTCFGKWTSTSRRHCPERGLRACYSGRKNPV